MVRGLDSSLFNTQNCLLYVLVHRIVPFLHGKREQAAEIFHSTCLTVTVMLNTATVYGSVRLPCSLDSTSTKVDDQTF